MAAFRLHQIRQIVKNGVGLDRAIVFSLLNGGAQGLFLIFITRAVVAELSIGEQALFYSFLGIVGIQSLFELGLNQVVVQKIAHGLAKLPLPDKSDKSGWNDHARYLGLVDFSNKYYLGLSLVFGVVVGVGGGYFIWSGDHNLEGVLWVPQWVMFILVTEVAIYLVSKAAVVEGAGLIAIVAKARMWSNLARSTVLFASLKLGLGLYSLPLSGLVYNMILFYILRKVYQGLVPVTRVRLVAAIPSFGDTWRELWAMQSKIACSYVWGFFIFGAISPVIYRLSGAEFSAKFGVTWALFQGVGALSMAWSSTKAAHFGRLAGAGDGVALWHAWRGAFLRSVFVASSGSIAVVLYFMFVQSGGKYLPWQLAAVLGGATVFNVANYSIALYGRAYLTEIMLLPSAFNGLLAVGLVSWACVEKNNAAAIYGYAFSFFIAFVVSLWRLVVFKRGNHV